MIYIYYILIILLLFQDIPLSNSIGEYGSCLAGMFGFIAFAIYGLKYKKIELNKNIKKFGLIVVYILILNILTSIYHLFIAGNYSFYGENLILKGFKLFLYFLTNIIYMWSIFLYSSKLSEKKSLSIFYYLYFVLFGILIIELINLPSAFPFLHATRPFGYNRIRLLTAESSYTAPLIWVFFTLALYYSTRWKNRITSFIIILLGLFFISTSTAKTLLVMILASALLIIIKNKKIKIRYKLSIILLLAIILVFFSKNIFHYIDLALGVGGEASTTISTRLYTFVNAFIISIAYPLGTSHTYYLEVFINYLSNNLSKAFKYMPNFTSREIVYYLNSGTDKNISAYSGMIQYGMYWGLFVNIYFFKLLIVSVKNIIEKNGILYFGFVGLMFAILTTISFDNKYEIWAFFAILMMLSEKNTRKKEVNNE